MFPKKYINCLEESLLEKVYIRNKTINYIKNDTCIGQVLKKGIYWEEWMFTPLKI
jgi:hypothetical protein